MTRSMLWRLVAKDLYFNRWIAGFTLAGCLVSIWLTRFDNVGRVLALVLFVTTLMVYGIFVGQESITRERREKISAFILSLPVSTSQYTAAKLLAAVISYLSVWAALAALIVGLTLATDAPNGGIPMFLAVMGLMLMNFCILLAVGIATTSQRWIAAAIIGTNTAVTLFMVGMFNLPAIQRSLGGDDVVWPPFLIASFAIEAGVIALSFWLTAYTQSRRKEFI